MLQERVAQYPGSELDIPYSPECCKIFSELCQHVQQGLPIKNLPSQAELFFELINLANWSDSPRILQFLLATYANVIRSQIEWTH